MSLIKKKRTRPVRVPHKDQPNPTKTKMKKKEREYWKLMELIPDNPPYSAYDRMEVLQVYMIKGSLKQTAKITGVPFSTIQKWRAKQGWWELALQELREQKNDEVDARITGIIDKTLDQMDDRVANGDYVMDKMGELVRKPVSLKDLAVGGLAVPFDKRALMRGQPTSRTEHVTDTDRVKKLAQQFKKITTEKVIEGELLSSDITDEAK